MSIGLILGITIPMALLLLCCCSGAFWWFAIRRRRSTYTEDFKTPPPEADYGGSIGANRMFQSLGLNAASFSLRSPRLQRSAPRGAAGAVLIESDDDMEQQRPRPESSFRSHGTTFGDFRRSFAPRQADAAAESVNLMSVPHDAADHLPADFMSGVARPPQCNAASVEFMSGVRRDMGGVEAVVMDDTAGRSTAAVLWDQVQQKSGQ